jgi:hypothetical protein
MLVPEIIEADMDMSGAGTTRPPAFVAGLRNPASPRRGFSLLAPRDGSWAPEAVNRPCYSAPGS